MKPTITTDTDEKRQCERCDADIPPARVKALPGTWLCIECSQEVGMLIDLPLFAAATFSVANFYTVCQRELYTDWVSRLKYLPVVMAIGIGLAVNNTRAVLEAIFRKETEFTRTPKYGVERVGDEWQTKKYHTSMMVQPLIELTLGLYFTGTVLYALANGIYGTLPFLMLFQAGFLYVGCTSIMQQLANDGVLAPQTAK